MHRLAFAAVMFATPLARAEHDAPFAVGLDYTAGYGGHVEALDLGWRLEPGLFLRLGQIQATVSAPWHPAIHSDDTHRDSDRLWGIGLASRLAYHLPVQGVGQVVLGIGVERRWLVSDATVVRGCRQTGDCIAGTYMEQPSYHAWASQLRLGVGPEKRSGGMIVGATAELIVEAISARDVPPNGIAGISILAALTATIGGGGR